MSSDTVLKDKVVRVIEDFKIFLNEKLYTTEEAVKFFEEITVYIYDIVEIIDKYCSAISISKGQYFSIAIYLVRFPSIYTLFMDVYFQKSLEKDLAINIQSYLSTLMLTTLNDYEEIIFNCTVDKTIGSFLNLMDTALDKIDSIDIKLGYEHIQSIVDVISDIIEEILCLSMSIAQVSCGNDNTIISSSCRSVLNSIEDIKTEINKEEINMNMCNLVLDVCNDTLCAFEAKINTAVLRLCLNVFSDYKTPLNNLYNACINFTTLSDQNIIDTLTIEFDLHMDRLFQIALFSVASSTIGASIAEIKSIIKNLEFLECELVPSFMSLTKCKSHSTLALANALRSAYIKQISLLRKAVHGVIEPSAYCKLVYEELHQKIEDLWQCIVQKNCITSSMLDVFFNYTKELGLMSKAALQMFDVVTRSIVKDKLQVVQNVMNELEAARTVLINDNQKSNKTTDDRIFKRCQILVKSIKQLQLVMLGRDEDKFECEEDMLCSPAIEKLIAIEKSNTHITSLSRIVTRGKQILKDRSMCQINFSLQNSILDSTNIKQVTKRNDFRQYSYRQNITLLDKGNMSIIQQVIPKFEMLKI